MNEQKKQKAVAPQFRRTGRRNAPRLEPVQRIEAVKHETAAEIVEAQGHVTVRGTLTKKEFDAAFGYWREFGGKRNAG